MSGIPTATPRPLRVALVCDWYRPRLGGIERHLEQLATHLAAAGHAITVITPTPGPMESAGGVQVVRLDGWRLPWIPLAWTPVTFRQLGAVLRPDRFDVVHTHGSLISPTAYAGLRHACTARLPAVHTAHSIWGGFRHAFGELGFLTGWTRWPVTFSAVSERVARDLRPLLGHRPVHVLPNAVEPSEWRLTPNPPADRIVVAAVMRLAPRKRGAALLRIARDVRRQLPPSVRLTWRLAGDGPERARLERQARRLGLADEVEFLGAISPPAVKTLLAGSHLFALPAELEAFGLAALEARAAGLPVVAMRSGGVGEWLAEGREGLLAADDAEFGRHILRLATDAEFRANLAAHNRATPVTQTWARSLAAHLELYAHARRGHPTA
ncbi:MAG TPA: glycosyltransferase family 4 protein [Lacunisphaera sp.]